MQHNKQKCIYMNKLRDKLWSSKTLIASLLVIKRLLRSTLSSTQKTQAPISQENESK